MRSKVEYFERSEQRQSITENNEISNTKPVRKTIIKNQDSGTISGRKMTPRRSMQKDQGERKDQIRNRRIKKKEERRCIFSVKKTYILRR